MALIRALGTGSVAWHAQWEPPDKNGRPDRHQWAAQILAHHFPDVPNHGDITAIDYTAVEPVDALTAGFPCTDVSLAGHGAGIAPGTRSGVWAHVARAIGVLRPRIVFIENVRSLTSATAHCALEPCPWCVGDHHEGPVLRALGAVLGDLADLGFDAEWLCLPASGVGACHERYRAFIAAWPAADAEHQGRTRLAGPGDPEGVGTFGESAGRGPDAAADPDHLGGQRSRARRAGQPEPAARHQPAADPASLGRAQGWAEPTRQPGRPGPTGGGGAPAHPQSPRLEEGRPGRAGAGTDFGIYTAAITRWEHVTGQPVPEPRDGRGRLAPAFAEWMMGLPAGWVTAVPKIPRAAQLKALGNGVVPAQGTAALRMLIDRAEPLARIASELTDPAVPEPWHLAA
jgi:DNA (cytosine-5)-methyltransferase 1